MCYGVKVKVKSIKSINQPANMSTAKIRIYIPTAIVVQISVRPKVTLSQTSRLFIDILYIAAVIIVRTINSRKKRGM